MAETDSPEAKRFSNKLFHDLNDSWAKLRSDA